MDIAIAEESMRFYEEIVLMKLIFQDEVSVIPSVCFILSLFKLNALLLSY